MHDLSGRWEDVKRGTHSSAAQARARRVRRACNRGLPQSCNPLVSPPIHPFIHSPMGARAAGLGGVDAAAPPPGTTPPSSEGPRLLGIGETEGGAPKLGR